MTLTDLQKIVTERDAPSSPDNPDSDHFWDDIRLTVSEAKFISVWANIADEIMEVLEEANNADANQADYWQWVMGAMNKLKAKLAELK